MKRIALILASLLLSAASVLPLAAEFVPLQPDSLPPGWRDLVQDIRSQPAVVADFSEQRIRPFQKRPTYASGTIRLARDIGLSLDYAPPAAVLLVVRPDGIFRRSGDEAKPLPESPETRLLTNMLADLLTLNLKRLDEDFYIKSERKGNEWTLLLEPRPECAEVGVEEIRVQGSNDVISKLVFVRSGRKRVEISMDNHQFPLSFDQEAKKDYFLIKE